MTKRGTRPLGRCPDRYPLRCPDRCLDRFPGRCPGHCLDRCLGRYRSGRSGSCRPGRRGSPAIPRQTGSPQVEPGHRRLQSRGRWRGGTTTPPGHRVPRHVLLVPLPRFYPPRRGNAPPRVEPGRTYHERCPVTRAKMWKLGYRCASSCRHGDEPRGASVSRRWPGCRVTRGSRTGRQGIREGLARTVCRRSEQASEYLHMAQNQAVDSDPRAPPADRARSVLTFRHGVVWGSFGPARVLGRPRQAVCSSRRSVQGLFRHGRSDGRFVPRALFGVRQGRRRARGASAGSRREIEDRSRILEIDMETIRRIFSKKYAGCFGNESFQHPDHIPVISGDQHAEIASR